MSRQYPTVRRCTVYGCDRVAQPGDLVCKRCAEEIAALDAMDRPRAGYRGEVVEVDDAGWWERWGETACAVFMVAMILALMWAMGDAPYPPGAEPPAYVAASEVGR